MLGDRKKPKSAQDNFAQAPRHKQGQQKKADRKPQIQPRAWSYIIPWPFWNK
jgi:hypothetical protein